MNRPGTAAAHNPEHRPSPADSSARRAGYGLPLATHPMNGHGATLPPMSTLPASAHSARDGPTTLHISAGWAIPRLAPAQHAEAAADFRHHPYSAPPISLPQGTFFGQRGVPPAMHPYGSSGMHGQNERYADMHQPPPALFPGHYHPHQIPLVPPPPQPPAGSQEIPQLPRRVRCTQACNHCHRRKARCVRNVMPDGSMRCDNCIREGIVCEWRESRRRGPKRKVRAHDSTSGSEGRQTGSPPAAAREPADRKSTSSKHPKNAASIANLLNEMGAGVPANNSSDDRGPVHSSSSPTPLAGAKERSPGAASSHSSGARRRNSAYNYVLPPSRRPRGMRPPVAGDLVERFMKIDDVELREAVLAYYAYFYGFCPILHPSTLLQKVVDGSLSPLLDDSLRATTSMFVARKLGHRIDAAALFSRLVSAITIRPEAPSVDEVCAFQLASIGVSGVRGFVVFDTLKSAVSSLLMQLNWHQIDRYESLAATHSWEDWVEAEVKRRVFWINYKVDSHHANIAGRPPVIDEETVFVRAPCPDSEWDELSRELLIRGCFCDSSASALPYPEGPWTLLSSCSGDGTGYDDSGTGGCEDGDSAPSVSGAARATHGTSCQRLAVGVQEELSRSFRLITPYESFMARISTLLRDAKASWVQKCSQAGEPEELPALLSESALFKRYDTELQQWRAEQVVASSLRDPSLQPWKASFFGGVRHRIFLVRVRYYCINIYVPAVAILLHSANRRSFFTEAIQQQSLSRDNSTSPALAPRPDNPSQQGTEAAVESEEQMIARVLNQTFGPTWCQGLIANDIEPESWRLSVQCAHEIADCLRNNSDIPLEFLDMVIPIFLFIGITVLLRQIRLCYRHLEASSAQDRETWEKELKLCLQDVQVQWKAIREMGATWRIESVAKLLNNMHIDEVEQAAQQLASMSL